MPDGCTERGMLSRRAVLSATGLAIASLSGCLRDGDGAVGDAADGLAALPAPRGPTERDQLFVTHSDLSALRAGDDRLANRQSDLGDAARQFDEDVGAFDVADVNRVTAQLATTESGEKRAAVLSGSFDASSVRDWIEEEVEGDYVSGEHGAFEWFAPEVAGSGRSVIAVSDRRLLVRTRPDDAVPADELATETVQAATDDEGRWFADLLHFPVVVSGLTEHDSFAAVSASSNWRVAESRPSPLDQFASGGLGTTVTDDGATVDVRARFWEDVDVDAVRSALDEYTSDSSGSDPVVSALEYEATDGTVGASATVERSTLAESRLEPVLRLPLYAYVGSVGGSDGPVAPQVAWEFEQRGDDRIEITHVGGDAIRSGVTVSYVSDGERYEERWDGDIQAGDSYVTERSPDTATTVRITWEGDERAAVLGEHTAT